MTHTHDTPVVRTLDGGVRTWLRLEGLAMFIAGTVAYSRLGGDWIWFLPALLAVDVSLAGYLGGPRTGAFVYNLFHVWATGLAVIGIGLALGLPIVTLIGSVLIAHTGMDRTVGYGLKLSTGFGDTHLGRVGKHRADASGYAGTSVVSVAIVG